MAGKNGRRVYFQGDYAIGNYNLNELILKHHWHYYFTWSKVLIWYLLVQSQQWKHQNNAWNLFKVNSKDARTTSWYLYCSLWSDFIHCSAISIVYFEQAKHTQHTSQKKMELRVFHFLESRFHWGYYHLKHRKKTVLLRYNTHLRIWRHTVLGNIMICIENNEMK